MRKLSPLDSPGIAFLLLVREAHRKEGTGPLLKRAAFIARCIWFPRFPTSIEPPDGDAEEIRILNFLRRPQTILQFRRGSKFRNVGEISTFSWGKRKSADGMRFGTVLARSRYRGISPLRCGGHDGYVAPTPG